MRLGRIKNPTRYNNGAERAKNTEKMRRYRATPEGRDAARRAAKRAYHNNKHKPKALRRKGQPQPLWPVTERCELCGNAQTHKILCLDHCHATGRFRGWLCDPCNTALGLFRDNPVLLRRAAYYLETPL